MSDIELISFITASIVIIVVPGVDFALVTRQTLRYGRAGGFAVLAGLVVGALVHASLAVAGISALVLSSTTLYTVLRIAGALYLFYVGATILWATRPKKQAPAPAELVTAGGVPAPAPESPAEAPAPALAAASAEPHVARRSFTMGIASNLLNPKVIIMYVSFVPQFVRPGEGAAARTAFLAATFIGLAVAWWILYITLIHQLHGWLTRPRVQTAIERLTGAILLILAIRLALSP